MTANAQESSAIYQKDCHSCFRPRNRSMCQTWYKSIHWGLLYKWV